MDGVLHGTVFVKGSDAGGHAPPGRYADELPFTAVRIFRVIVTAIPENSMMPRNHLRTRTNTRGEFRFIRVPEGPYTITFSHDDFKEHSVRTGVGRSRTVRVDAGLEPKEPESDPE